MERTTSKPKGRTLEEVVAHTINDNFKEEYGIVDAPITAFALGPRMVWVAEELRVVETTSYEISESGELVVAVSASDRGQYSFSADALVTVWHIKGKPFVVTLPPHSAFTTPVVPPTPSGGSPGPAHDAAGIVPVSKRPQRPN
jgi:hypothetical protein